VFDSEDVLEQRASACLPDPVPMESAKEHAAREQEIAALDAVGDFDADENDAGGCASRYCHQDSEGKRRAGVYVLVFSCVCVCVCVCVRARAVYIICVRENLYLHFLNLFVCVRATEKVHRTQVRELMGGWSDHGL
jgi:hypothetical protein